MKRLIQTRLHESDTDIKKFGNCFPTVLACLMDKNSPEDVIQIQEHYNDEDGWMDKLIIYLESEGYELIAIQNHLFDDEFYLVTGQTERGTCHIVIYKNGELFHDPHPSGKGLITQEVFEQLIRI
jgi:hypothetical protein